MLQDFANDDNPPELFDTRAETGSEALEVSESSTECLMHAMMANFAKMQADLLEQQRLDKRERDEWFQQQQDK